MLGMSSSAFSLMYGVQKTIIKSNIIATLSDNRYREEMLQFLKDIIDESENFSDLSKKVQIYDQNGNQPGVNISFPTAGTYEFKFFVVDRQSNVSNNAVLTVVAE